MFIGHAIALMWDAVNTVLYVLDIQSKLQFLDVFRYKAVVSKGSHHYLGVLRVSRI